MAEKQQLIGGYDLDFVDNPPDDLLCLICLFPAKDAVQLNCCGKIFCHTCLSQYSKTKKECSNCRRTTGTPFNDMRSEDEWEKGRGG
jgi:hypothetical protein